MFNRRSLLFNVDGDLIDVVFGEVALGGDGFDGGFLIVAEIEIVPEMVFYAHFKQGIRLVACVNDEHDFAALFRMEVGKVCVFDAFVDFGEFSHDVHRAITEFFIEEFRSFCKVVRGAIKHYWEPCVFDAGDECFLVSRLFGQEAEEGEALRLDA